jgi:hypothetical protein
MTLCGKVYPKVPGLTAWSENCKWYSSLPLGAVVSLFCLVSFVAIILCVASQWVVIFVVLLFLYRLSPGNIWTTLV